jgi:hypothetical protein
MKCEAYITGADDFFWKIGEMTIAEKVIHCKKPNGLTAIAWGNAPKKSPKGAKANNVPCCYCPFGAFPGSV